MKNGRCQLHGGKSTGAKNPHRPTKHGRCTADAIARRRELAQFMRACRKTLERM